MSIVHSLRAVSLTRKNCLPLNTVASLRFNLRDLKQVHLNAVWENEEGYSNKEYENEEYSNHKKRSPLTNSTVKDRMKEGHGLHHDHRSPDQFQQPGQTAAHGRQPQQHRSDGNSAHRVNSSSHSTARNKVDKNMSGMTHSDRLSSTLQPQPRVTAQPHSVSDRMKDPRLRGADLYVTRLCWKNQADSLSKKPEVRVEATVSNSCNKPRSLHDELYSPSPKPQPATVQTAECAKAAQSRPCYRCIYYVHSAGIKRVFWTNSQGEWEGAKVRDLVDALEAPEGNIRHGLRENKGVDGVFVTKHEVLRLREMMGV